MLKILLITSKATQVAEKLRDALGQNYVVQFATCDSERDYPYELLSKETFDLIITFDLVGFEQTTLMGGISYNLVNSKFVNFLLHENLQNEKYLSRQLSLSMFFYCADRKYETYLREHYPDIPYLKTLQGSEETVENAMRSAVEKVLTECHLV
ncbi:hypothetical protein [Waltera intestinalis]|uniref:Uncharacterized protein n=1 Tax=Waltera intestinalis TaxID=2606635 RepID=A0A6L5YKA4_9FIRM|nr:hypothetical protein [Waltera intestinalis]MST58433.1 hypothetical protein [Waltera intestinalis]